MLALGFRPFFLLGTGYAVVMMTLWLGIHLGLLPPPARGSALIWHVHELVFGVMGAVVAGFLLTAVRNWTQLPTPAGLPLAGLALLWLAGRGAAWLDPVWGLLCALADTVFLLALAIVIAIPIVRTAQRHNYQFIAMLTALALSNLVIALDTYGVLAEAARPATFVALYVLVWLLVAMGGRVIPFFTERRIDGFIARRRPWLDHAATLSVVVAGLTMTWPEAAALTGSLLFAAAALNAGRWLGWYTPKIWRVPLLWVLHTGYLWLVLGLALHGLAQFLPALASTALHALSIGGIIALALGMMARVSLGHTGRALEVGPAMIVAFALIHLSAVVRTLLPLLLPGDAPVWIVVAGLAWILAFGIFLAIYFPLLVAPRADGQPG